MSIQKNKIPFVKYHTCLSYMFSPSETRFILHMLDVEFMKASGYNTSWRRSEYMKKMGLSEYSFLKAVKRLKELELLIVRHNSKGNRVYYSFNLPLYNNLLSILSSTNDTNALIEFCDLNFKKNNRNIESITQEEINKLREAGESNKRFNYTETFPL